MRDNTTHVGEKEKEKWGVKNKNQPQIVSGREKMFERKLGDSFGHDEFDVYSFAQHQSLRDVY